MKKNRAWHYVANTLRDGTPVPKDGVWLEFKGKCVMCESGLHASRTVQAVSVIHLWDAPDVVCDYLMTADESLRAAAWAAAWAAAKNEFNQLVYECFEDFL